MESFLQRILILLAVLSIGLGQRRGSGEIDAIPRNYGGSSSIRTLTSKQLADDREPPNRSTEEAEYLYEYYEEPDYQVYPPRPSTLTPPSSTLVESLQGRSVSVGNNNVAILSPSAGNLANVLAASRERYIPTTPTKRPAHTHTQLSRFKPSTSSSIEKTSTEVLPGSVSSQADGEYEYIYEEEHPSEPSKEIQTKVSVSVSTSSRPPSPNTTPISIFETKSKPESGFVISVATTKSVSSHLNYPKPSTTPSTPPNVTVPSFRRSIGSPALIPSSAEAVKIPLALDNRFETNTVLPNALTAISSTLQAETLALLSETSRNGSATSTTTQFSIHPSSSTSAPLSDGIKFEDVSRFLPPDYNTKKSPPSSPSLSISALIPKIQFQEISLDFLPKDYVMSSTTSPSSSSSPIVTIAATTPSTTTTTTTAIPISKNPLQTLMGKIRFEEDISALLPPGYKESLLPSNYNLEVSTPPSTSTTTPSTPTTTSNKVIFPTRPGGNKAVRPTTPEPIRAETPPPPKVTLKPGWPTRKTTEFTGWPTQSTTPMSTSTTSTTPSTLPPVPEPTTTTVRTTTTLAPPKRSPTTLCESNLCKMEATIRITGGVRWKPEYADINTEEWKHLENTVKRELDGAYRSSGLAPFYRTIEIEAFNEGSVVVDYFLLLDNVDREISSEQVRSLFHAALLQGEEHFDSERLRMGRYTIDPRFTDFKVRAIEKEGVTGELEEALIPQWGIAIIVIGLASLLFVVIFAVTLVVSKQRKGGGGKKSGISLTHEMLTEFNKQNTASNVGDSGSRGDLYSMEDVWNDSHLEQTFDLRSGRRSTFNSKEGYNIYDSWKTEWNGYNHQNHYGGGPADSYTRRRSDYDTNF